MNPQEQAHQLIERYVREVERNLPKRQRSDVAAELRSLLEDALNDRALSAERPPDEDLAAEVLRDFGEPDEVAERYLPAERYLIGPRLYPAYLLVVKIVLFAVGGIMLLSFAAGLLTNTERLPEFLRSQSVGNLLGEFIKLAFVNLGLLTLVFAIIERVSAQKPSSDTEAKKEWNPRELPRIEEPERISAVGRVAQIYVILLLAAVFNFFPEYFGLVYFTDERVYAVSIWALGLNLSAPVMNAWWFMALAMNMALLRVGRWTAGLRWWEFGLGVTGGLIVYWVLATADTPVIDATWMAERGWELNERAMRSFERVLPLLGKIVKLVLSGVLIITIIESLVRLWRLATRYRGELKQAVM